MKQDKTYKTKDIFEASWIYSQNIKLLGLEPDGRYSWFVFEGSDVCKKLSNDYWAQEAIGNVKLLVNALKTLKDLVYSRQDGKEALL